MAKAAERLRDIGEDAHIRIIAHIDADGITACAMLMRALLDMRRTFSVSFVKQLSQEMVQGFGEEPYRNYIFLDLGASAMTWIEEGLMGKEIIIIDHHEAEKLCERQDIVFVDPHGHGIDGGMEIAAAGLAYLIVRQLDASYKSLAHLAIIGAIGDCQERNGFIGLNKMILDEAIAAGVIETHMGLRCFGRSRPLHRLLEQSKDIRIAGVTGSEEGALAFLHELGIEPKRDDGWRRLSDLDEGEMKRLMGGIIARRSGESEPADIFGSAYLLREEADFSPIRDAREFSTLLNACGRLGKAAVGIGVCMGDERMRVAAMESQAAYKRELQEALRWVRSHHDTRHVIEEDGFIIINMEDNVRPTIIGTLVSILARDPRLSPGTCVLGMAQDYDGMTKVSLRVAGQPEHLDARAALRDMMLSVGGAHGGHRRAAGGVFPSAREPYFLEAAKDILRHAYAL